MIQVSVTSTEVRNQSGTAKASGKPYSLNFQTVWFHTVDRQGVKNPYPEKAEIILEKNEQGQSGNRSPPCAAESSHTPPSHRHGLSHGTGNARRAPCGRAVCFVGPAH